MIRKEIPPKNKRVEGRTCMSRGYLSTPCLNDFIQTSKIQMKYFNVLYYRKSDCKNTVHCTHFEHVFACTIEITLISSFQAPVSIPALLCRNTIQTMFCLWISLCKTARVLCKPDDSICFCHFCFWYLSNLIEELL